MAILDETTEREVRRNKAVRGYIIRTLGKGNHNTMFVKQLVNILYAAGHIDTTDISKYLEYLQEAGYIAFTDKDAKAANAYRRDTSIRLTKAGVDLLECTKEDAGVDI